jgi:hypothetical protein
MTELLWLDEEELRNVCRILATRLCQTENRMLMMAVEMEKAVAYGYRVGFEDAATGEPFALTSRDEEGLVLH